MRRRTAFLAIMILIVLLMVYSAANVFPHFALFVEPHTGIKMCMPVKNLYYQEVILPWLDQVIYTITPPIIIFTMNALIIWKLYSAISTRKGLTMNHNNKDEKDDATRRVTVMLLTVSSFFLLTTLPLCIFHIGEYRYISCNSLVCSDKTLNLLSLSSNTKLEYANHLSLCRCK